MRYYYPPIQARARSDGDLVRNVQNMHLVGRRIPASPDSIDVSAEYGGDPRFIASEEREERRKRRPHMRTVHSLDGLCGRYWRSIRYCDISLESPGDSLSFAVNIVGHTKFQFFGFFIFMSLVGEFGFPDR